MSISSNKSNLIETGNLRLRPSIDNHPSHRLHHGPSYNHIRDNYEKPQVLLKLKPRAWEPMSLLRRLNFRHSLISRACEIHRSQAILRRLLILAASAASTMNLVRFLCFH